MLFSSFEFIFFFLPLALAGHALAPGLAIKNAWLLLCSLAFFAWGEPQRIWIMVGVATWAWAFARLEERSVAGRAKAYFALGVAGPLALLFYFKYAGFLQESLLRFWPGAPHLIDPPYPGLPLGISFFVFQAVAFSVDARRKVTPPAQSWQHVMLSISLFFQLIAGPIERYRDLRSKILSRRSSLAAFGKGFELFCFGLAQKVLMADTLGRFSAELYRDPAGLGALRAWLAAGAYSLQLYLDFSGYSLMALGLGRMFGFRLTRNFLYPYRSLSVREFWRRWHRSLSAWFRDYVYHPLGGSRAGTLVTLRNLWVVFVLCGLWHGAAWTFLAWGCCFGILLTAERLGPDLGLPAWLRRAWVLAAVTVAWALFNAPDLDAFLWRLRAMAGLGPGPQGGLPLAYHLTPYVALSALLALAASAGLWPGLLKGLPLRVRPVFRAGAALAGLWISLILLSLSEFKPFLYFRF